MAKLADRASITPQAFSGFGQDIPNASPVSWLSRSNHDRAQLPRHDSPAAACSRSCGRSSSAPSTTTCSRSSCRCSRCTPPRAQRRAGSCRSSAPCSSCRSCSSPATRDRLADVYSKRTVLVVTKSLEIVATGLGLFAFVAGHLELTYAVLFLIAAAGDVLQPGEIRHPARDAARPRPVARERRARDEHVRRDRRRHGDRQLHVRRAGTTGCG